MGLQRKHTIVDAGKLLRIGVLGLVEIIEDDDLIDLSQLTKNLIHDRSDCISRHFLSVW